MTVCEGVSPASRVSPRGRARAAHDSADDVLRPVAAQARSATAVDRVQRSAASLEADCLELQPAALACLLCCCLLRSAGMRRRCADGCRSVEYACIGRFCVMQDLSRPASCTAGSRKH